MKNSRNVTTIDISEKITERKLILFEDWWNAFKESNEYKQNQNESKIILKKYMPNLVYFDSECRYAQLIDAAIQAMQCKEDFLAILSILNTTIENVVDPNLYEFELLLNKKEFRMYNNRDKQDHDILSQTMYKYELKYLLFMKDYLKNKEYENFYKSYLTVITLSLYI